MLKSLTDFLRQTLATDTSHIQPREHTLELCAAVLMLEIALADSAIGVDEQAIIIAAIREHFHLDQVEAEALLDLARQHVNDANSLHDFTRAINADLSREEKTTVIELLWRVAAADNVIHKYEEYFIRKISDLLYVSHKDYILAKHRATAG
jgi:uncharacterized tellurite resistance protein B-like protein